MDVPVTDGQIKPASAKPRTMRRTVLWDDDVELERCLVYVTSASIGLTPGEPERQPQAGSIFALEPGIPGPPEPHFAG